MGNDEGTFAINTRRHEYNGFCGYLFPTPLIGYSYGSRKDSGVVIKPFSLAEGDFSFSARIQEELCRILDWPIYIPIKCVLIFSNGSEDVPLEFIKKLKTDMENGDEIAIAGGLITTCQEETSIDNDTRPRHSDISGYIFGGKGVDAATAVVSETGKVQIEKKFEVLKEFVNSSWPPESQKIAFNFACCGRKRIPNEITSFRKFFPDVPIVGQMVQGEFAAETPGNVFQQCNKASKRRRVENPYMHSFTSVYTLLSFQ